MVEPNSSTADDDDIRFASARKSSGRGGFAYKSIDSYFVKSPKKSSQEPIVIDHHGDAPNIHEKSGREAVPSSGRPSRSFITVSDDEDDVLLCNFDVRTILEEFVWSFFFIYSGTHTILVFLLPWLSDH